jgi:oligopeptide transport system permease protein
MAKEKLFDFYKIFLGILVVVGLVMSVAGVGGVFSMVYWGVFGTLLFGGFAYTVVKLHLLPYLFKRIFEAGITLFVIVTIVFALLRLMPGGPFDTEKALPPEVMANLAAKYKLDAPLAEQYTNYLNKLVHGDLGESYKYIGRPVSTIIGDTFPISLQLGIYALILSYLIGIPLGVIAASKHNSWVDTSTMFVAMSGVTLPSFLVAAILILIFSFQLQILPPALWEGPIYYILPVITLGIRPAAIIARLTRSSVLDVIRADFVRTAYAKGLSQKMILFKHVLKNSLIPVLTYSGPLIADIISGAFIIEMIFAVPGMGRHLILSVTNRDYPLVLGMALLYSVILVVCNLLVDLCYAVVDPRIKLAGS